MKLINEEKTRLILAILVGFIMGFGFLTIQYQDRDYTAQDLANAYERGSREALKINPASDRLEIVCAALWFAEQAKE